MFEIVKCDKCKGKVDSWDYNWNGGLCGSCKNRRMLVVGFSLFILAFIISIPIVIMQFNYNLERCGDLKSRESSYDFSNRIEINAKYNEECYFLHEHPLAFPSYLLNGILVSVFIGVIGGLATMTIIKPIGFRRVVD